MRGSEASVTVLPEPRVHRATAQRQVRRAATFVLEVGRVGEAEATTGETTRVDREFPIEFVRALVDDHVLLATLTVVLLLHLEARCKHSVATEHQPLLTLLLTAQVGVATHDLQAEGPLVHDSAVRGGVETLTDFEGEEIDFVDLLGLGVAHDQSRGVGRKHIRAVALRVGGAHERELQLGQVGHHLAPSLGVFGIGGASPGKALKVDP